MRRPFTRRHLRFSHPGKLTPGCKGQRRFRCRFSDVAAGSCSFLTWCRFTLLSPFAGAETSTTRLAVQGTAGPFAINFSRPFRCRFIRPKKISRSPPDICTGLCSFTPLRRTALKRVKVTTSGAEQQVPAKVKTAAPATQRVRVFKSKTTE